MIRNQMKFLKIIINFFLFFLKIIGGNFMENSETQKEINWEKINNIDVPYICEVIKQNRKELKELNLRDKKLNIRNTAKILNSLEVNDQITIVDISSNLLDDSILLPVSSLLVKNNFVKKFYIEDILFSYRIIVDFIDALKSNRSIIEFKVQCGKYEREIISDLCERNLGSKVKIPIHILEKGSASLIIRKMIFWTEKVSYLKYDLQNFQNGRVFYSILQYYEKDLLLNELTNFSFKSTCKLFQKLGITTAFNIEKGFSDENELFSFLNLIYNYFHQEKYNYLNSKLIEKQMYVFHF